MTNECGELAFTFEYDTYGKLIARTGPSNVIFRFNGRDGVITDIHNGLLYMRARYYSPELRRFVNADIIPGEISNAVTLNRYAYANGNPVSNVDPFGLSVERGDDSSKYSKIHEQYRDLLVKALTMTKKSIHSHYYDTTDYYNFEETFNKAYFELINSIENGNDIQNLPDGMKVKIEIDSNANTSFYEFMGELMGFVPVLGEIFSIVEYTSSEKKDSGNLWDAIISAITEDDIAELSKHSKKLKVLGKVVDAIGAIQAVETLINWNSPDKLATKINIFVRYGSSSSYMYSAFVDKELLFTELS